jgi:hypothetical protein
VKLARPDLNIPIKIKYFYTYETYFRNSESRFGYDTDPTEGQAEIYDHPFSS